MPELLNSKNETKKGVLCTHCGKTLKQFRVKQDWKEREMHKKCYKEMMNHELAMERINRFLKEK
jgi:hypothetical protein